MELLKNPWFWAAIVAAGILGYFINDWTSTDPAAPKTPATTTK